MTLTSNATTATADVLTDALLGTPATAKELTWFFNAAESAIDVPSNFGAIAGNYATSADAVERRVEAMHAADTIHRRLKSLPAGYGELLGRLYTERALPRRVERALGLVAGVVAGSPLVQMQYLQALASGRTKARTAPAWLEELLETVGSAALADWKRDAERTSVLALRAYEHVRGSGPSVAPDEEA